MAEQCRISATTTAFVFAAGIVNALLGDANPTQAAETAASAGATQDTLVTLETSAYEAWKSKNGKFWDTFLSDKFVGWGSSGRLDKASAAKVYAGADCEIKSYAISDVQMTPLGRDVALITHKITFDGSCGGKNVPATWVASAYVREVNQWKEAFHAGAAIVDPAAPPVKPARKQAGAAPARPADQNTRTDVLLPLEKSVWDAWKDHDTKRMDGLTATNMQFINIFGIHLATKVEALKNWSGEGCDVKTIAFTDAAATMLSPTVGILTFRAKADGTCFGQKVGPIWGSSIYVKHGETWQWNFGINLPASVDGG